MPLTPRKRRPSGSVQTPLETYLREINETALLTAAQERELAVKIGNGDTAARDRMVRANLRLVVNIARGYIGQRPGAARPDRRRQSGPLAGRGRF